VVGRNVGRPGEELSVTTLADLDAAAVDMNTLLIIGSSATRVFEQAGRSAVFTPRHYQPPGEALWDARSHPAPS
jgi:precorrin-3B methylase